MTNTSLKNSLIPEEEEGIKRENEDTKKGGEKVDKKGKKIKNNDELGFMSGLPNRVMKKTKKAILPILAAGTMWAATTLKPPEIKAQSGPPPAEDVWKQSDKDAENAHKKDSEAGKAEWEENQKKAEEGESEEDEGWFDKIFGGAKEKGGDLIDKIDKKVKKEVKEQVEKSFWDNFSVEGVKNGIYKLGAKLLVSLVAFGSILRAGKKTLFGDMTVRKAATVLGVSSGALMIMWMGATPWLVVPAGLILGSLGPTIYQKIKNRKKKS